MQKTLRIEELEGYIKEYDQDVVALEAIGKALSKWDNKLVDKRFFEEHFMYRPDGTFKAWPMYQLRSLAYSWSKHTHELYISQGCKLELMNREKSHIIDAIVGEVRKRNDWILNNKAEIAKLKEFDEERLIQDLQDLFKKYGEPSLWGKILDSYEVKYPSA